MSHAYQSHKFMLTQNQLKKVKKALEEDRPTSLSVPEKNFNGNCPLPLTETELQKIHDGEGMIKVSLSKKKLNHIRENKEGGFLPLLSLIPMILGGLGAAGGIAGGIAAGVGAANSNRNEAAKNEEQARHNKEIESKLGSGINELSMSEPLRGYSKHVVGLAECPVCSHGLELRAKKGKGLYLRPFNGSHSGLGLITGIANAVGNPATGGNPLPSLPQGLADIPIIGSIAKLLW